MMNLALTIFCLLAVKVTLGFVPVTPGHSMATQLNIKVDGRDVENEVTPTNNFILVRKAVGQDQTEGGIFLTAKAKEKSTEGVVVSTGPGKTHHETGAVFDMPVEAGDNILFGEFDGEDMTIDGVKHTLIQDDDVTIKFKGDSLTLDSVETLRDGVLVKIKKQDESSDTGILIARSSKTEKKASVGEVVKVGPGRVATNGKLMEMEVEVGDFVKFRDFATRAVVIEDETFSVVRMQDLLLKF
ncbi:unnamed protein product [Cylindrotheca closterium]|uniref:20 kDa chaperonin, chloroplastic n=1 Tax=Cylindrotheca closterium TaxID=2856 RepID=A0AAD2CPR3_9STRA|nr:unnamed protein product [Cylindrotheca closterium]